MARFRGTVRGGRSGVSKTGTVTSGLRTEAGSWSGGVCVDMYVDADDNDCCRVAFMKWVNGAGKNVVLYDGPVNEPTKVDEILKKLHEARMLDFEDIVTPRKRKVRKGALAQES